MVGYFGYFNGFASKVGSTRFEVSRNKTNRAEPNENGLLRQRLLNPDPSPCFLTSDI